MVICVWNVFFFFPAANDSHSASAVHHTAWANNNVRLHVYGAVSWVITVVFSWLSTAKYRFFCHFLLHSVWSTSYSYYCSILELPCIYHVEGSISGRKTWGIAFGSAFLQDWHLITYCHLLQAESDESYHISTGAASGKTVNLCGVEFDIVYSVWDMIIYPVITRCRSELNSGV